MLFAPLTAMGRCVGKPKFRRTVNDSAFMTTTKFGGANMTARTDGEDPDAITYAESSLRLGRQIRHGPIGHRASQLKYTPRTLLDVFS
jgi:hypothetical protein